MSTVFLFKLRMNKAETALLALPISIPVVMAQEKRALITGFNGFTGHYLARELEAAGYRVFGTAIPGEGVADNVFIVDLCDRARLAELVELVQPEVVVHLAGLSFVPHADVEAIYRINIVGTRHLLEALATCSKTPRAVLLASSANIYGNVDAGPIDENVKPLPGNDYAVSKLAMEHMAHLWSDRLPIVIVRPFNYTGVGQSEQFLLPKIVAHFRRKESHIELGNLDVARDFSDVRVVAVAYRRLVELAPAGEIFNVCSSVAYRLDEVLAMATAITGHTIAVKTNPAFCRANEIKILVGNNAKLHRTIGNITPISLDDTLRWMIYA